MTDVGIIGYSNNSGLGSMIRNFRKFGIVSSQFVIEHPIKGTHALEFPHVIGSHSPTIDQLQQYIDTCKPKSIIIIETPFNFDFFEHIHKQGIKVFVIPMIDSIEYAKFKPYEQYIEKYLMPTKFGFKFYTQHTTKAIHLPFIIDIDEFSPAMSQTDDDFLHNQGFGGAGFRKGTDAVFTAFTQLKALCHKTTMRVNSQPCEEAHSQLKYDRPGIHIEVRDYPTAIDVYRCGRVYIAPSRREGLGLPILEAMACGLPVITTDAPPMNEWFDDKRLLVKVRNQQDLPYGDIPMYNPDVYDLMLKMKYCLDHPDYVAEAGIKNREIIVERYSYDALKDRYLEALCVR